MFAKKSLGGMKYRIALSTICWVAKAIFTLSCVIKNEDVGVAIVASDRPAADLISLSIGLQLKIRNHTVLPASRAPLLVYSCVTVTAKRHVSTSVADNCSGKIFNGLLAIVA